MTVRETELCARAKESAAATHRQQKTGSSAILADSGQSKKGSAGAFSALGNRDRRELGAERKKPTGAALRLPDIAR